MHYVSKRCIDNAGGGEDRSGRVNLEAIIRRRRLEAYFRRLN